MLTTTPGCTSPVVFNWSGFLKRSMVLYRMVNTKFELTTIVGIKVGIASRKAFVFALSSFRVIAGNNLNLSIYIKNQWASLLEMLGCTHLIFYTLHVLYFMRFTPCPVLAFRGA